MPPSWGRRPRQPCFYPVPSEGDSQTAAIVLMLLVLIGVVGGWFIWRYRDNLFGSRTLGSAGIYYPVSEVNLTIPVGTTSQMVLNEVALASNSNDLTVGTNSITVKNAGRYNITLNPCLSIRSSATVANVGVRMNGQAEPNYTVPIGGLGEIATTIYPSVNLTLDVAANTEVTAWIAFISGNSIGFDLQPTMTVLGPSTLYVRRIA